jgi:hypothetical protein
MSGLIFIGIPLGYSAIGGYDAIVSLILFGLLTLLFPKERNAQHIKN